MIFLESLSFSSGSSSPPPSSTSLIYIFSCVPLKNTLNIYEPDRFFIPLSSYLVLEFFSSEATSRRREEGEEEVGPTSG